MPKVMRGFKIQPSSTTYRGWENLPHDLRHTADTISVFLGYEYDQFTDQDEPLWEDMYVWTSDGLEWLDEDAASVNATYTKVRGRKLERRTPVFHYSLGRPRWLKRRPHVGDGQNVVCTRIGGMVLAREIHEQVNYRDAKSRKRDKRRALLSEKRGNREPPSYEQQLDKTFGMKRNYGYGYYRTTWSVLLGKRFCDLLSQSPMLLGRDMTLAFTILEAEHAEDTTHDTTTSTTIVDC